MENNIGAFKIRQRLASIQSYKLTPVSLPDFGEPYSFDILQDVSLKLGHLINF